MTIERRKIIDRSEWLQWRRGDVTASVVAALFNAHPYVTPLRLYVEKRGVEFPNEDTPILRRGRWLEGAVATATMEERPGWSVIPAAEYIRDSDLRLGASPDFFIHDDVRGLGILQAKTVAPGVFSREWHDGAEVPFWVVLQSTVEAWLSGANFAVIVALLIDPFDMRIAIHELPRNPAAEEKIRDAVLQFWADVEAGREPDPDFSRDQDVIRAMWRREREPPNEIDLSGNNAIADLLAERCILKDGIKAAESRVAAIDAEVRFVMQDAAVAIGIEGWKVSYKTSQIKEYVVAAREQRILRVIDQRAKEG